MLDDDLIIMKEEFVERLYVRSRVHDALATPGHGEWKVSKYNSHFSVGLLFVRTLPGINYRTMTDSMYERQKNRAQGIISEFIQENYSNWDTLSLRWHCRILRDIGNDIPYSECYTIHDMREGPEMLAALNKTLLRLH